MTAIVSTLIEEIYFKISKYGGYDTYRMTVNDNIASFITTLWYKELIEKQYLPEETRMQLGAFEDLHVEDWNSEYIKPNICDGTQWELVAKYKGQRGTVWVGSNAYPSNWDDFLAIFGIDYEDHDEDA